MGRTASPSISEPAADGLIFIDDSLPGVTRRRCGKGWMYFDAKGQRITDRDEIDRLNAIALPPAYREAWFCPAGNGHVLATGIDDRGRKQYRYHPAFRAEREGEKFDNCARFGRLLPLVRKRVEDDLRSRKLDCNRAIASVVRLLDSGMIRIGNEAYSKSNKSFGATTLRRRHATFEGQRLKLCFRGKSGKQRDLTIDDPALVRFLRRVQDMPGQHLFQYIDDMGTAHHVSSGDVNAYLRETMGGDFTAKNFRTWTASALAFELLAEAREVLTLKQMLAEVSEVLGNTPAVARRSYVHPALVAIASCGQEAFRAKLKLPRRTRWLSRHERGLIDLLEHAPSAAELLAA